MLEYYIALRAKRLDDYGNPLDAYSTIRFTTLNIVKRAWLVEQAQHELTTRYPAGERWYGQQYSFDNVEWYGV